MNAPRSLDNVDPALAEAARSTVKQLQAHSLPHVQDWLRIITKVCIMANNNQRL